ncbi:phage tail assembly chaperone G [Lactococcus garvieae]|uniref:Phage protein n=1 Tax=Lactococcus garvieae TaxID=1363 RepID=A0AAX3NDP8_9LACT|nr:hypothetical protein [Lactococcus garvieae]NHI70441.1 hypothetical protein [Lactococcus garvieae]NHJ06351.1 hypothetical protein [Lactococcus garvieae]WEA14825.1 hypothetical protein PWF74_04775 [Lactococcus garvieae]
MSKLKLTLHKPSGDVIYEESHVSGQKYLDYWNMQVDFEQNQGNYMIADIIEKRLEFTASLFKNEEVTAQAILEGTAPWDLVKVLNRIEQIIIGAEETDSKKEQ